jgi:hypothetical protein
MDTKARYARLSILTGSRFIELTASFVQRFTGLGEHPCTRGCTRGAPMIAPIMGAC